MDEHVQNTLGLREHEYNYIGWCVCRESRVQQTMADAIVR